MRRVGMSGNALSVIVRSMPPAQAAQLLEVLKSPVGMARRGDAAKGALSLDVVPPSAACTEFRCVEDSVEETLFPPEE